MFYEMMHKTLYGSIYSTLGTGILRVLNLPLSSIHYDVHGYDRWDMVRNESYATDMIEWIGSIIETFCYSSNKSKLSTSLTPLVIIYWTVYNVRYLFNF